MALQDVFLLPLGLLGLLALVPVIVLYLLQPDPRRVRLPTLRFLYDDQGEEGANPLLERLKRSLLLLVQLLVLVALATSIAAPYVSVAETGTADETVLVVDASASMATQTGGATRFDAAVAAARDAIGDPTSVVVVGAETRVPVRRSGHDEAQGALADLAVTDAPGDLAAAISQASSLAGQGARLVVFSDFAGDSRWTDAVRSARARGLDVELRQFAGGGTDNVGIVDRTFSGQTVTFAVRNFGTAAATRTLSFGGQQRALELDPGDVRRVTFPVPAGGGRATLTPGDSLPTDDLAYVAAPEDGTVDVLVLTNRGNRYLTTAMSVIDVVELTVREPPTTVEGGYDVILYTAVDPDRLLRGNVEAGRSVVESGGGVGILAQEDPPDRYGDLLLLDSGGVGLNPSLRPVGSTDLTDGIDFPPPEGYLRGSLRSGEAPVRTANGTPIVATAQRGDGRLLYYGYLTGRDAFQLHYQYPVFWKRAVFYLAGRDPLPALNRATGDRLTFLNETAIETPDGRVTARTYVPATAGYYSTDGRRLAVSLLSDAESDVVADPLGGGAAAVDPGTAERTTFVPRPLTEYVALVALFLALLEVAFLRYLGDL